MGDKSQISFNEIESYLRLTNTKISNWDILALRRLSLEYIIQLQKNEKMEMPPFLEVDEYSYLSSLRK